MPTDYIARVPTLAASFLPGYTPDYSNANFALLGIALENVLGEHLEEVFNASLAEPLGFTGTTITQPREITNQSVIPSGDAQLAGWSDVLGPLDG